MLKKCVLTVLELNWNKRLGHKKTKLNICHHMLTSSTQLQNRSFHVVERTITSSRCQKMKYARAKRAKILFSIVKYANLWGFCCRRRRGCLSSLMLHVGRFSVDLNATERVFSILRFPPSSKTDSCGFSILCSLTTSRVIEYVCNSNSNKVYECNTNQHMIRKQTLNP